MVLPGELSKLKEWFTTSDAARYLSDILHEEVNASDVLRLALDGHLTLSVNFTQDAYVKRAQIVSGKDAILDNSSDLPWNIELPSDNWKEEARKLVDTVPLPEPGEPIIYVKSVALDEERFVNLEGYVTSISGVWDLPMISAERIDVENRYQKLVGEPDLHIKHLHGSYVNKQDGSFCQLQKRYSNDYLRDREKKWEADHPETKTVGFMRCVRPHMDPFNYYPAPGLPVGSALVVRRSALVEFLKRMEDEHDFVVHAQEKFPGETGELPLIGWRDISPPMGLKVGKDGKKPKGMNAHIATGFFPLMCMPLTKKPYTYLSQIKNYLARQQK